MVNNDQSTATTYYGDFGMNSSAFSGTGSLSAPNSVYVASTTADLVLGTTTANGIHFVVNNGATDAMAISSAGVVTIGGNNVVSRVITSVSSGGTLGAAANTDYVVLASGTNTQTLPTAVGNKNRYTIKNTGTGVITVNTTSSQTIDVSLTITLDAYTAVDIISDNANWWII